MTTEQTLNSVKILNKRGELLREVLGADLGGADLLGANLRGAYLGGADLCGADLCGADLGGAYLGGAYLHDADLRDADLGGAYLRDAYLRGADLGGADLGGADLGGADLRGADLRGAYLGGADLGGADLRGADLGGAYLHDADLGGADLRGAKITWSDVGPLLSAIGIEVMTAAAVVAGPAVEPMSVGRLRVAEEHARDNWRRLVEHAQGGRCTCHLGVGGSVHVVNGCVTGRMLHEEYWRAAERVRELTPADSRKLEAGDFDGLDPGEERSLLAQAEAADPDPRGEAV